MRIQNHRWKQRWINPKAEPFNSPIHGIGGIAIESISLKELICIFGGIIVPTSEIDLYREENGHVGIQIEEDYFICPSNRENIENSIIFNHSCDPNCGFGGTIQLVAMRSITIGEELTLDYALMESHFEHFQCKCGLSSCRGTISPDDWKIPGLQNKYRGYFSPYLKQKIHKI